MINLLSGPPGRTVLRLYDPAADAAPPDPRPMPGERPWYFGPAGCVPVFVSAWTPVEWAGLIRRPPRSLELASGLVVALRLE